MSGKSGKRETAKKPEDTRRHDSLADGAFGHDSPARIRSGEELNVKISGQPSKQHSKYLKRAKTICKELQRKKVRKEPNIVESTDRKFRLALTGDRIFCFRRDLLRAFYLSKTEFQSLLGELAKKNLRMIVEHPLGKLKPAFNRKNSEKIKSWLAPEPPPSSEHRYGRGGFLLLVAGGASSLLWAGPVSRFLSPVTSAGSQLVGNLFPVGGWRIYTISGSMPIFR